MVLSDKNVLEEKETIFPIFLEETNAENKNPCIYFTELAQLWFHNKDKRIKKSSRTNYMHILQKNILPHLGGCRLEDLSPEKILQLLAKLQEKGYANSTINFYVTVLRSILREGIKRKCLPESLLESCVVRHCKKEAASISDMDSMLMKTFLLEKSNPFSAGLLLSRSTGIRIGELCGLKWEDFDFDKNVFFIRRTVSRIANPVPEAAPKTILYIRSPKSSSSRREIPIPQYLREMLYRLKKEDEDYFLTGTPHCTEPRNVQKRFKTVLRHCNLPDYNFHALRHGFASACLEGGGDYKTISSILGHASVKTTMDIYIHTSLAQKQSCIDSIS